MERLFYEEIAQKRKNYLEAKPSPKTNGEHLGIATDVSFLHALQDSRIFYVNSAVVESLANLSPMETNYEAVKHMPFENLFFEMSAPLKGIRGFLFGNSRIVDPYFSLPEFSNLVDETFYSSVICSEDGNIASILASMDDVEEYKSKNYPQNIFSPSGDTRRHPLDEISKRDTLAFFSLGCNLIDYINAHNVTIRKVDRDSRNIDRINRKRKQKGKKILEPLKPYYWIDVRESPVGNASQHIGDSSSMDYREWVRGHFQRYHTREGTVKNWIQPYARGPEDAPLKENRYRVLEDILKKGPRPISA